jgi:hypothetical protein
MLHKNYLQTGNYSDESQIYLDSDRKLLFYEGGSGLLEFHLKLQHILQR